MVVDEWSQAFVDGGTMSYTTPDSMSESPRRPQSDGSFPIVVAVFCFGFGVLSFLAISLFAWTLKDGLGPGSVESQGWAALHRYLITAGWPLLVPVTLFLLSFLFYRGADRRSQP